MYLGLIEARYDYQLSYLDQWAQAWQRASTKTEKFNLVKKVDVARLQKKCQDFDLLVVLHSVTADSNSWLTELASLSQTNRAPMILFVGNEFSSPFLSTETRLNLISQIAPEIIASQLLLDCASWLYEKTGSQVITAPPGLPDITFPKLPNAREINLGYRGFSYPWYLLDDERNDVVDEVTSFFLNHRKKTDVSLKQRYNSREWFDFLRKSDFTVSSEAGSRYVFRDDEIWTPVQEYFQDNYKFSAIPNDASGMNFFRKLPGPLKNLLKKVTSRLGVSQASLFKPTSHEVEELKELINLSKHDFRNGKAISSRHFDAIACGTWQILAPGSYNNILKPGKHFSTWEPDQISRLEELMENPLSRMVSAEEALTDLLPNNSYSSRVDQILRNMR